jgi:hypothetical protein
MKKNASFLKKNVRLREILSNFWNQRKKNKQQSSDEKCLIPDVKNEMKEAANSYKSIMEIQNILVDVYKKITKIK